MYNVGPTSLTLVQHCTNVTQMFCVDWVYLPICVNIYFESLILSFFQDATLFQRICRRVEVGVAWGNTDLSSKHEILNQHVVSMLARRLRRRPAIETDIEPMLFQCWSAVYDVGPTLNQQCLVFAGDGNAC